MNERSIEIEKYKVEIKEFTGHSDKKITELCNEPYKYVAKQWRDKNPRTSEQIEEFYKTTDAYLYDLPWVNSTSARINLARWIFDLLKKYKYKNILDFGGGTGEFVMRMKQWGFKGKIFYYDLPSITQRFARFRTRKRNLDIIFLDSLYTLRAMQFDFISTIDVLEHLPNVEETVKQLVDCLRSGGLLSVIAAFGAVGKIYPCHLKENKHWDTDFPEILNKVALKPTEHMNVFQKI